MRRTVEPFPRLVRSGGQTGVDRAALDAARACGLAIGGWCPAGRRAEDGTIPAGYPLRPTAVRDRRVRTRLNVRDSDATLVLLAGRIDPGTRQTIVEARRLGRPLLCIRLGASPARVRRWLRSRRVGVLNVAGPRESRSPGIAAEARAYLEAVFSAARRATRSVPGGWRRSSGR